jgi:hypothetical protein
MFTPSTFPCVAWRINQRSLPVPIIIEAPYVGLYHTDPGLYLCEGGWLLHGSELYESIYQATAACVAVVAEREDRRYKLVECNVPTWSSLGVAA